VKNATTQELDEERARRRWDRSVYENRKNLERQPKTPAKKNRLFGEVHWKKLKRRKKENR